MGKVSGEVGLGRKWGGGGGVEPRFATSRVLQPVAFRVDAFCNR